MSTDDSSNAFLEPERYELTEGPAYRFEVARREFIQLLGGGVLLFSALGDAAGQESGGGRRGGRDESLPQEIGAWLHIAQDGAVTVFTGKAEVGQNIRTSLTEAVSEELRVTPASIRLVMADTELTPYDMGTFGSLTTPVMSTRLRRVAAAARELMVDLAAERMKLDRAELVAADGKISYPRTGRSVAFSDLVRGERLVKSVGENTPLTPADTWRVAGTSLPKVEGRAMVTGAHRFTSDINRPGMVQGRVLRPSAFGASLSSLDSREAEAIPGVQVVRDGDFVGVVAPDERVAARAVGMLRAEWQGSPQPKGSEIFDYLKKNPDGGARGFDGRSNYALGSIEEGLSIADKKLDESYTVQYIAHAPLEPRAAVAEWENGKLTLWTGTQRPFGVREELAQAFRLAPERVRVIVPDTGSGYGGKHTGEAAVEAARLAKAAGKPVKLVWTREEEFTWAYFRPAGVIDVKSGARTDGSLVAWEFHNYNSGASALRTPYDVPHQKVEFHPARSPLRQGSYRGLAATANHFARETHMDELAHAVGMDPLEFRVKNLKDPRLRAVLEAAAERLGWGDARLKKNLGIACGLEKGGYVATGAEVSVDAATGRVELRRLVAAFECGAIVNPDGLKNQVEGAIVQGLGGALFEAVEFEGGRISNPRFSSYRVPRAEDVPILETVLIDRKDLPSAGAGETPIVAVAPAIGNAIFHATGIRLRALPLVPHGLPLPSSAGGAAPR